MAQRLKTDWILFLTIVLMVCFGLVILYSASSVVAELKFHSSWRFLARQLGWIVVSFIVLMFFKKMDYRLLRQPVWAFAPIGLVMGLLGVVYFLDPRQHRWLTLGPGSLQPSELAKPALVLFLAYFITLRSRAINDRHTLIPAGCVIGLLGIFVGVADFGTALVLVATAAVLFYVAGLSRRNIALSFVALVFFVGIFIAAKPYRMMRIISFVDKEGVILDTIDPAGKIRSYAQQSLTTRDASYQAKQSRIAVGAGGPLGLGLMQGHQKLLYLPEAHTDFIYAVVGEELGLWGTTAVLAGFVIILWRGLRLFWIAPDDFGRYLALGITTSIIVQALINMSVVLDMGPTKGIPLPMISYGGSSLLSTLTSLGLLLSVSEHAG